MNEIDRLLLEKIKPKIWKEPDLDCKTCDDTGYILTRRMVHNAETVYSHPCGECHTGRAIKLDPKAKWASNLPAKTRTAMKRLGKLA